MFSFREIIADVRTTVVSMITAGALLILTPLGAAVWKLVQIHTNRA